MLYLTFIGQKWTDKRLQEALGIATAIGPFKRDIDAATTEKAHALGLKVVPYTFRTEDEQPFPTVREEMRHYLYGVGIDGLFTNNPDQFPRTNRA